MNALCYKTVFSKRLGALVAVGEHATSQSKGQGAGAASGTASCAGSLGSLLRYVGMISLGFASVSLAWSQTLPQGGRVSQGQVTISQSGQQMAITQSTAKAVVNWDSFDIGANAKVNIAQPSSQSVLLNRVLSDNPTQILGQLQANGQVVLVNPKGIVVGSDGSVSASAFTASTLNISDADFMAGNGRYTREGSTGEVVNKGRISVAPGGYVALLGARVSNEGQIIAPQGAVALGAAETVSVPIGRTGKIKLELTPASINASVANQKGGVIVAEGGQVYMQAAALGQAVASVLHSGHIDTSGAQAGAVHVLADGGQIKVDGSIKANSSGQDDQGQLRKGGDIFIGRDEETGVLARTTDASGAKLESLRGFVETSGDHLTTTGTRVKAAEWLLDPYNITIASSTPSGTAYNSNYTSAADSVILASDISANLSAGTSVTIATGDGGTGAGDIHVNANIAKSDGADATLTLRAHNDIVVASNTTITSTIGRLNVVLNSDFDASGAGAILFNNGSGITSNGGNINLGGGAAGTGLGHAFGSSTATPLTTTTAATSTSDGITLIGATISAGGGNINMTGTSNASNGSGINTILSSSITTSGAGAIALTGHSKAGGSTGSLNGVGLLATTVTGGSGGVTIVGDSSAATTTGAFNYGVMIKDSTLSTDNGGNINMTGKGGGGTATSNRGFSIDGSGRVSASGAGNISITGIPGTSATAGININSSSGGIHSTTGTITLNADSVAIGAAINSGTSNTTIQNYTAGTLVNIGGADVVSGSPKTLGITNAELGFITAGSTVLGSATAGNLTVSAATAMLAATGNLTLRSGGNIAVNGSITKTAGTDATLSLLTNGNINVANTITGSSGKLHVLLNSDSDANSSGSIVFNNGSGVTSNGGNITLGGGSALNGSGTAVGDGATSYIGIHLDAATFNAGGGNIAMTGTTFRTPPTNSPNVHGFLITGGAINTTGAGTIALKGYSNVIGSTFSKGLQTSGVTITGGSTGTVSLMGDSRSANGSGNYLFGVRLVDDTVVTSLGGNIEVTGYGGNGSGGFAANIGVALIGSKVAGVGAGTVTISGTGGQGSAGTNAGVSIYGTNPAVSSQGADINIIGQGGNGPNSEGIVISSGTVGVAAGTTSAHVILTADSTKIETAASINSGTGTTTIQNRTAGTLINVGGADVLTGSPLTLGVTNDEMNRITAGTLKIGSTTTGAMTTSAAVTTAASTGNLFLQSGSTLAASHAITSGAGLYLQTTGDALSNSAALSGTNISLDNSNGSINLATGAITSGAGITAASNAVSISGALTATRNLNIYGASGSANGVNTSANWSGQYINAIGTTITGLTGFAWNGGTISTTGTGGASTASTVKGISAASTTASNGYGALMMFANGATNAASGTTLTFAGEATTLTTGQNTKQRGILVQGGRTLTMSGDVTLDGSSKSSEGISFGGTINMGTVAGVTNKLTIKGTSAASTNASLNALNFSGAINGNAATSSINLIGEAKNLSGTSIDNAVSTSGTITGSSANVNIQALYGKVSLDGAITGANISVDNTGGTIDATTGAITAGAGTSLYINAVNINKGLTATGKINLLGRVATTTHTGVNLTATAPITSSGATKTIDINSNGHIANAAAITNTGSTGTGANINLTSTSGTITGAGAIGDTTNKNASVTFTQSGTSTYSGAINAANFTKAGTGSLTLDSWIATPAVASNVSSAYTVKAGALTLAPGSNYPQLNPSNVNVENASTFAISASGNGWWKGTAFNFTGGSGGGTMNLGGNPIGQNGTTNTISTSGGATNTITGTLNANYANVNINLASATSGTTLANGGIAALAFTQSTTHFGIGSGGGGATTINVNGGGNLLFKDKVNTTNFNINAGTIQFGDGTAASTNSTPELIASNVNIASGANLIFNRPEAYTNASIFTGVGSLVQAGSGTLTLTGNSNAFAGSTAISAGSLQVGNGGTTGSLGTSSVTLSNNANLNFVRSADTVVSNTISGTGNVSATITGAGSDLTINNAMAVTGGTINLSADGNVAVVQSISTNNTTANAVVINAGKATNAGTATGGDISFSGSGGVSVGSGGRATLFTGSVAGSTGLGIVNGNNRFNSDELAPVGYTTALGSGIYAIYREAPTLSVRFNDSSKTYDGQAFTGGAGVTVLSGLVGNDTSAVLGTVSYTGTAQNAVNADTYVISGTTPATSALGYSMAYTNGTLTVNKANVTATGSMVYDASTAFAGSSFNSITGVNGETFTATGSGTLASQNVQTAQALQSLGDLSLVGVSGALASNYNWTTTSTSVSVTPRALSVTGANNTVTYNGAAQTNTGASIAGNQGSDSFTISGYGTGTNASTTAYADSLSLTGTGGTLLSNYSIGYTNGGMTINKAALTVTGANNTVTYNGNAQTNTGASISGNQGSDSFTIIGYGNGTNASATANPDNLLLTGTGSTLLSNYNIGYTNGGLTIGKANLTATGSMVYDASTAFAGSSFSSIAGVNGETFTATGSGTLANPNVQSAQTLQGLGDLSLVGVNGALASNYNWTTTSTSVSVTPRALSVTGANNTVTYNGAAQTNTGASIAGNQGSDSFTISGYGTGTNASTTAYADSLSLTGTGGTLLSNYSIGYTNGGLTINRATLTVTGANNTVTYNGSAQTNTGASIVGTQSGDGFSISGYASGTNASNYNDSLSLTGTGSTLLGNYNIGYTHGSLTIDKANLALSGTRVYDAGTSFAGQYLTASGVAGQTFSVTGSGNATNLASKNVQINQALNSVTGLSLGSSTNGGLTSNYNALTSTGSSVSVTSKALTATATATDKTYNATTQATLSGTTSADIIGSDNVVVGHTTASFADANVARDGAGQVIAKTVSVSGLSLSGTDALNYSLQNTSATTSAKITPQAVSLSSLTAAHKVYDGNVNADITGATFSGTVNTETLSLTGTAAGSFANKNVGTAKVVSVADVSALTRVNGTGSWNNYQLSTTGEFATSADITPKNVTIASLTASNKTYDGNANATITAGMISTGVGSETLAVSGTGLFNNKNAGNNKEVTVADVTALTRSDGTGAWSNYNLNQSGALTTTASIAPKAITLGGITAVDKVYDRDTAATASNANAIFDGKITGDDLTVQSTGVFADKNVGQLKNVTLSHVLEGADLANYTISTQPSTTASITPKSATVSATPTQLTYNGAVQNQSSETRSGFLTGDTITVAGQASGKNAGTYGSGLVVSGVDANNYNITVNNANLVIDKANLTVTANADTKIYDANLNASGTGTVAALAGAGAGDVVNSPGTQAFLDANAGTNKTVRASGVTIKDASNADMTANYTITYVDNTTSVINKAALTVTANDDARFVGLADNVNFAGVKYDGLVGGETSSVLGGTLLVERSNAGTLEAGVYAGVLAPSGLSSSNYDIGYTNGDYTIVPADQLLIRTTNQTLTYGFAPVYETTAKYLQSNGQTIITLTRTGTDNDFTFNDGANTSVRTVLKPYAGTTLASTSSTGHTVVGNYDIKDLNPTVIGGNFKGAPVFVGSLAVNTKAVTPNATGVSKVYDGTTAMNNVVVGLTGEVTGDQLSISGTGAFTQKNVGTNLHYNIANITLGGDDAGNYHLSGMSNSLSGSNGSITRAPLVLTSSNVLKTYDRSTSATGTAVATNGTQLFGADSLSGGTFVFDNKNAGTGNKVVRVSGVTVGDGNSGGNYTVSYVDNTTSTIWAKNLTASYSAANKTYNGNTLASVTGSSADIIDGDVVSLSHSSAHFDDKNVGTHKTVTVNGIALGGADAGNYSLQNTNATSTANISAKSLTVSYTASDKAYDGLTDASVSGSSSDIVSGDDIGFTQTAHFEDKNVANGKGVSITLIGLNGADASNYDLAFTTASASANITPKDVSLSSITAAHKVYDGNNTASISSGAISTGVLSESLTISGSGTFSDANAADGKTVTVANVSALTKANGTGDWNNYNLTTTGLMTTTANITRKDVTLDSINATHKVYDGNNTASITSGAINTGVGTETLAIGGTGSFSSKDAGDNKNVTVADVTTLTKTDGTGSWNNYNLTTTGGLSTTANITRKAVTITSIAASDKVYDGSDAASIASGVVADTVGTETLNVSGVGLGSFSDKNAANGKVVTVADVSALTRANGANGGDWSNYQLTSSGPMTTQANITPKDVSLSSITADNKVYDGSNTATITSGAISTGVGSETLAISGQGTFSDANAADNKVVTVAQTSTLTQTDGSGSWSNYRLTTTGPITTTANITRKNVSLSSITAAHKVYDGSDAAAITTGVVSGAVGTESLSVSGVGSFSDANAADNKMVSVTDVTALTKTNGTGNWSNYNLTSTGSMTTQANVTRKDVSLSSITAAHKVYDGSNAASITAGTISTGVGSETLAISGSGSFSDANAANNKTVTVTDVTALTKTNGTGNWSNYNLTPTGSITTNANITRKDVTLDGITAAHKVYDGNNAASITSGAINTGVGSETLDVTGSGTFSDANATNGKTVSVTDVTALTKANGTGNWNNYNLTTTGGLTTTANITRKNVSLSSVTALDKVYDGNNTATITSGAISTGVGSETLAISGSGTFSDANAANNKTVTVANVSTLAKDNGTGNWSNYNLTTTGAMTTTADIIRKDVTLTSITAADKVYDGTAVASITGGSVSGTLTGESLSVSGQGSFADKHVASNKTVTVQDVSTLSRDNSTGDWRNYQLITTGALTDQADITPKALSVTGITAAPKTYDGNTQATVATSAVVWDGRIAGDNLSLSSTGTFSDKNAGTAKVVTLTNTLGGTDLGNYTVTAQANTTANITTKALSLSAGPLSKTYDGNLNYSTSAADLTTLSAQLISGDTVTTASLVFTDKNAGTGNKNITFNSATLQDGNNGGNYSLTLVGNSNSTINKATITAALQGTVDKTYDGLDSATLNSTHFATSGWVSGEGASISQSSAVYADKNVSANPGNGTVSASLQLGDYAAQASTDLNNYSLPASASGAVGRINPASLNIKVNDTKMFVTQDANLAFDQGFSYTGLVNGESATNALTGGAPGAGDRSYTGTQQFPAVGSLSGVYGLSTTPTALNGNYSVSVTPGNLQVIPADKLLVTISSQSDVYGQRQAPQAGAAASGTVTAQYCLDQSNCNGANLYTLNLNSTNGSTWQGTDNTGNTINLGTGLAGTPTYSSGGYLNTGNHTYALASLSSTVANQFNGHEVNGGVLTITPLQVGLNASDVTKVYDGNNSLMSATLTPSGTLSGDALQATFASGSFTDKNAGAQGFTLSGLALQGADQANYVLGSAQMSGTGSITPKTITVSGLQAQDKVYDGTTQASVLNSGAVFNGIVAGDQLSVTATGQFDTRHVGTNKTVSLTSSFGGADLGNYSITPQASSTASITPAPLVVTASAARKTYDGNTTAPGVGTVGTLVGAAAGDKVDFGGTQAFADKQAGNGKTVTVSGVRLIDGGQTDVTGNYAITYVNSQNSVIDKANASITALAESTVYNGSTQSQSGVVLSGFLTGDDVRATGLASGRNAGSYASSLSATGADAGNYIITYQQGALTIDKASLQFVGTSAANKVYDGKTEARVTPGSITGLMGSETLSIDTVQGQFDSAEMGTAKPVQVVYGLSDGANGGLVANYQWSPVTAKASITTDTSVQTPAPALARQTNPISRLSFLGFGGLVRMGATTGQLFYAIQANDTRTCSPLQLEGCICEQPQGQSLEVCYPAEMAQQAAKLSN